MTKDADADAPTLSDRRKGLAERFNRDLDRLAEYAEEFEQSDIDPFDLFCEEVLYSKEYTEGTRASYERLFEQWRNHMNRSGRHPACPNEDHVRSFAQYCLTERGNQRDTVRTKLRRLNKVYRYWQSDAAFPHPRDFNPFVMVLSKMDLSRPEVKDPPRIPVPELRAIVGNVQHLRDRAVLVVQLKLGLRATELCNLQIQDINISDPRLKQAYPKLGTHTAVSDRSNSVYIATRDERAGNKSRNPRVLPLDDELQGLLRQYLLVCPDADEPWVFLSQTTHSQLDQEYVNQIWTAVFRPEYDETESHRAVTSHFGRHRFTTYWRVEQDLNRELVQYMRGDTPQDSANGRREAIDDYLHTYYEDIEAVYRENIFRLNIEPRSI
jgi:integrase/recombinase XerD